MFIFFKSTNMDFIVKCTPSTGVFPDAPFLSQFLVFSYSFTFPVLEPLVIDRVAGNLMNAKMPGIKRREAIFFRKRKKAKGHLTRDGDKEEKAEERE